VLTHFSQRYPKVPVFKGGTRVGVAFDLMRLDFKTGLPRVPSFLDAARSLFPEEEEAEATETEAAP
jgi:ribonuclease Z